VEATATRPVQNLSVAFELRGDGQRGELKLLSPLGTQVAAARWAPGLALLVGSEGERRFASLDALSLDALGEALPLAALPHWLQGRPWDQAPHTRFEGGFEQLGWRVLTAGQAEGRIEASRSAPPAVLLRVRLDNPAEP
jgi:outer membrane lipoprotein LolB